MNILEHYIEEIHAEEEIEMPFETSFVWIEADITVDCYGHIERTKKHFIKEEWEDAKIQGYYLA